MSDDLLDFLCDEPTCPYEIPAGVRLVRYEPKEAPLRIEKYSTVVNDLEVFIRACLMDLRIRLENMKGWPAAPIPAILERLKAAGVEVEVHT